MLSLWMRSMPHNTHPAAAKPEEEASEVQKTAAAEDMQEDDGKWRFKVNGKWRSFRKPWWPWVSSSESCEGEQPSSKRQRLDENVDAVAWAAKIAEEEAEEAAREAHVLNEMGYEQFFGGMSLCQAVHCQFPPGLIFLKNGEKCGHIREDNTECTRRMHVECWQFWDGKFFCRNYCRYCSNDKR
jgi:hypothetical protein